MKGKWFWTAMVALPLAIGGLVYAGVHAGAGSSSDEGGFICPLTGEELPCPRCCPLD
ncbi:MAG: hypothetical protein AB7U20_04515 [Planctomycetaceae bacterium]